MKKILIATHSYMAKGVYDTVNFITNDSFKLDYICAYVNEISLEKQVKKYFSTIDINDEVIIFTDMKTGSVNQTFIPYINSNVHIVTGFNLPLVLEIILSLDDKKITDEFILEKICVARDNIELIKKSNEEFLEDE